MTDTIVAISTPPGTGAIGIVRLSGVQSLEVLRKTFRSIAGAADDHRKFTPQPARAYHGNIHHPITGQLLDEVVVTAYRRPRSYTGEDLVEISAHGSPVILHAVVEACLSLDDDADLARIRLAEPGEFTLRAFLNGRIDLAQAEAVADMISAQTDLSAQAAVRQLSGALGVEIKRLTQLLVLLMTHIEASLDFPEDELEPWSSEEQFQTATEVLHGIQALASTYHHGRILREGMRLVIAGKPNVGKSSLLNALLRHDRAIVTPVPGTTRDTLEESLNLHGVPIQAIDTAGIRSHPDPIEQLGIERARAALDRADLVLIVHDGAEALDAEDEAVWDLVAPDRCLLVINKIDRPRAWDKRHLIAQFCQGRTDLPFGQDEAIEISALHGTGLEDLERAIAEPYLSGTASGLGGEPLVTRLRHKEALDRAESALGMAVEAMQQRLPGDIVSVPLREAMTALGEITGENLIEDAIHNIFAEFCVGK